MANQPDAIIKVAPHTNLTFRFDCNSWEVVGTNGDTVASGSAAWADNTPTTVDNATASSPADRYLHQHITGFSLNADGSAKTYYQTLTVTTTGGSVEDFFITYVCDKPNNF